jgi:hypothetical protein
MTRTIRSFMLIEAIAFALAALTHFGILLGGYEHQKAGIAESVIAAVLAFGLLTSVTRPTTTHGAELAAQSFALFGTLVGIFTIIVGVGPRTVPDIVYHLLIVMVLATGLIITLRARRASA